jgi:hypothetical protein
MVLGPGSKAELAQGRVLVNYSMGLGQWVLKLKA